MFSRGLLTTASISDQATQIAKETYEKCFGEGQWDHLKHGTKRLLSRNTHQVLGLDLKTKSDFVICWTPDGIEHWQHRTRNSGGTGQTVALASMLDIPVFNLKNHSSNRKLDSLIKLLKL